MFNDNSCDKEVVESNEQNAKEIKVAFIFVNNLIMFFMICVFYYKGIHFVLICFKSMLHLFFVCVTYNYVFHNLCFLL
ncbi:hypothetical protein DW980_01835, partial [Bacteroides stercoris]